jgi:hypothetical protein
LTSTAARSGRASAGPRKLKVVEELGADLVIDYTLNALTTVAAS